MSWGTKYLASLPYVAKNKIGLVGFSRGGWTIMRAVQEKYKLKSYRIRGTVAYYPYPTPKQDTKISVCRSSTSLEMMTAGHRHLSAVNCRQATPPSRQPRLKWGSTPAPITASTGPGASQKRMVGVLATG